jgi:CRISPR-associated protein Cmr1
VEEIMTTSWIQLSFQIDTPMFLGGAGQVCDPDAQFIPSLRGALRFWFRALVGPAYGGDTKGLAAAEAEVFGWAAEDGKSWGSSPVRFRLESAPKPITAAQPNWLPNGQRDKFGVKYLLGQGLWDFRNGLTRGYLPPGQGKVGVSVPASHEEIVACCFWALSRYGGLGSRSRKGFGGVTFTSVSGSVPFGQSLATSWRDVAVRAQAALTRLGISTARRPWGEGTLPSYPCFDTGALEIPGDMAGFVEEFRVAQGWQDWNLTLGDFGQRWRCLRTIANQHLDRLYTPRVETREWLNVIHGPSDSFALGALGMPINFAKGRTVVPVNLGGAGSDMRYPSPIRFKVTKVGAKFDMTVLLLACTVVPPGTAIEMGGPNPITLYAGDKKALWRMSEAMKALKHPAAWPAGVWERPKQQP